MDRERGEQLDRIEKMATHTRSILEELIVSLRQEINQDEDYSLYADLRDLERKMEDWSIDNGKN